jgi:hypothetical protein
MAKDSFIQRKRGQMSADEGMKKVFNLFHQRAVEIDSAKLLRFSYSTKISAEIGKPTKIETNFPDIESVRSFASLVRPFYNNDDSISFTRMCNIISNPANNYDDKAREQANEARKAWNKLLQKSQKDSPPSGTVIDFNGQVLTTSKLIDLYFNSRFFHTNIAKHELLKQAEIPGFEEQMLMNLFDVLQKMGMLVLWVDKNIIEKIINAK